MYYVRIIRGRAWLTLAGFELSYRRRQGKPLTQLAIGHVLDNQPWAFFLFERPHLLRTYTCGNETCMEECNSDSHMHELDFLHEVPCDKVRVVNINQTTTTTTTTAAGQ